MTSARRPSPNRTPLPGGQPPAPQALPARSLTELVRAIRDGSLSPTDLVSAALASLHRWQPVTTAASQVWPEEAQQAARALPANPHLPLAGIPVLVKENMDVAGHKSTACCDAFRDRRASEDAQVVASLRAAGAIVVGKANMHELAASATGHISACGPMHNPWDPVRLAGGSSGGSAAAVAARSVPLTLGTDTAGSIRVPSSFCGVAGLKPTQGRLSMRGIMPLAPSLGCVGPVAACAEDLGLAFSVLAGAPESAARMRESAAGLMVARAPTGYFAEGIHPDVRRTLDSVAEVLAAAGLLVTDASLRGMEDALGTWGDIAWPELVDNYPDLDLSQVGSQIAAHYSYGKNLPEERKSRARAHAREIRRSFLAALRQVDALLLPCTPYPAPRLSDAEIDVGGGQVMNVFHGGPTWFTCPVNIAGLPAVALPAGFDANGLPLGVQLVGRPGEEWTLLRIAVAFEAGAAGDSSGKTNGGRGAAWRQS
jgi:aspartyl-tRNA(Asn)/glutamyl-tRNA(Gln) amidotransferase subunit A